MVDTALNGKRGARALNKDTPAPGYRRDWAPELKQVDGARHHGSTWELLSGQTYKISGRRFNGMTQSASYGGGSQQSATNYPLVRITNDSSGHVVYCRTHDHSGMAVASEREVSTFFDIPSTIETGPSKLEYPLPPRIGRSLLIRRREKLRTRSHFSITPQAMRPPESPAGSDLKSSR